MNTILVRALPGLLVAGGLVAALPVHAQPAAERNALDRCVGENLTRLAKTRPPEKRVAEEVLGRCDRPLRAVLAASIRTGEAAPCVSVEECIGKARARMAQEVALKYRQLIR